MTIEQQLEWLNEGAILLMNVMGGRDVDNRLSEYRVFEEWRKRGQIIEPKQEDRFKGMSPCGHTNCEGDHL